MSISQFFDFGVLLWINTPILRYESRFTGNAISAMKELRELILQIKELSPKSSEARKLKNALVSKIKESHLIGILKLKQLNIQDGIAVDLSDEDIDELRLLALAETLNRIDEYNPDKAPVMAWINWSVKNIYRTERNKKYRNKVQTVSLDAPNSESTTTLHDCLPSPAPSKKREIHRLFRELIQNDPEDFLKNVLIKSSKTGNQISLQKVLLMRLEGITLAAIDMETGVSYKSINSSINRNKAKLKEYITKHTGITSDDL